MDDPETGDRAVTSSWPVRKCRSRHPRFTDHSRYENARARAEDPRLYFVSSCLRGSYRTSGAATRMLAVTLLVVLAVGCSSSVEPGSGAARTTATTVATPLPDLSKLVPTVQAQITAQHDVLTRTLGSGTSTVIERANAYGELAKLFMAAQLPEAAVTTFQSAQSLDPTDYRWPYYLAQLARSHGRSISLGSNRRHAVESRRLTPLAQSPARCGPGCLARRGQSPRLDWGAAR